MSINSRYTKYCQTMIEYQYPFLVKFQYIDTADNSVKQQPIGDRDVNNIKVTYIFDNSILPFLKDQIEIDVVLDLWYSLANFKEAKITIGIPIKHSKIFNGRIYTKDEWIPGFQFSTLVMTVYTILLEALQDKHNDKITAQFITK